VVPLKASDEQGIEGWPAKSPNTNTPAENKKRTKAPIIRVETLEAFKKEVGEEKLRLVAVKFFSPTCRACKAMSESFKALSVKYPNVKFVEVPLTQDNAMLHHGLGVPSFPFGHLYHPEAGLVEEGSINRKQIVGFEQKLKSYLSGSCPLSDDD
jgi:thiol-disulfide isomerase/thioredoxin